MKSHQSECPLRVDWQLKVPAESLCQILTVLSQLPLTSMVPSGLHVTDETVL